jgi:SAM-dependent methyltransferase
MALTHPPDAVRVTRGHGKLEKFLSAWRARKANRLIPPEARSGRVLDVGCGSFPYFLTHTEFAEKHGADRVIDPMWKPAPDVTLHNVDLDAEMKFPFPEGHFTIVTMLAVFEHIRPTFLVPTLAECRRVLKAGGRLVLTTPAPWTDGILRLMGRTGLVSLQELNEHKGAYGPLFIRSCMHDAGFAPEQIRTGYFQFGLNVWATATKT